MARFSVVVIRVFVLVVLTGLGFLLFWSSAPVTKVVGEASPTAQDAAANAGSKERGVDSVASRGGLGSLTLRSAVNTAQAAQRAMSNHGSTAGTINSQQIDASSKGRATHLNSTAGAGIRRNVEANAVMATRPAEPLGIRSVEPSLGRSRRPLARTTSASQESDKHSFSALWAPRRQMALLNTNAQGNVPLYKSLLGNVRDEGVIGPKYATKTASNTLRGTVYGGPNPLSDVVIVLFNATTLAQVDTATTDVDGRYSFSVADGVYNLLLTPPSTSSFVQAVVNGITVNTPIVTQNVVLLEAQRTLSGTVYASDGHTPVEGIRVDAWSITGAGNYDYTNASGHYSIGLPGDQTYTLSVSGEVGAVSIPVPDSFGISDFAPDVVLDVNRTQNLVLMPFVHLSGRTLLNGASVADTEVYAYTNSTKSAPTWGSSSSATSDAGGNYDLLLLPGSCEGRCLPLQGSGAVETYFGPLLVQSDTTYDIDLNSTLILSGVVYAADGLTPVSGLVVGAWDAGGGGNWGTTDNGGNYSLELWSGTFWISVSGEALSLTIPVPDYFSLSNPAPAVLLTSNQVVDFSLPQIVEVSGRTLGNGVPIPDTEVTINTYTPTANFDDLYVGSSSRVNSDSNGNYSALVMPGDATFLAIPPEGSGFTQTNVLNVSISGNTALDINLTRLFALSGIVYASDGVTPASGVSVRFCFDPWYGLCGVADGTGGYIDIAPVTTDVNGGYEIAVPAGSYGLYLAGSALNVSVPAPDYFEIGPVALVSVSGTTVQDLQLPAFVHLSGQTLGNGAPVPDTAVYADTRFHLDDFLPFASMSYSSVISDPNGHYDVLLMEGTGSVWADPPGASPFVDTSYSDLAVSGDTVFDIVLTPLFAVSGTVFASDGVTPVSWIQVVFSTDGYIGGWANTDTQGHFVVFVTAGTHQVEVWNAPDLGTPNIPSPMSFDITPLLSDVVVSSDMTLDLLLPEFISLSGYATDSNGVAVPDVTIDTLISGSIGFGSHNAGGSSTSATSGYYEMLLLPGECGSINITPPENSGFIPAYLGCVDIPGDLLQNVILSLEDTRPPVITAGPFIRFRGSTFAVVVWETDEPATSDVNYGLTSSLGTPASSDGYVRNHVVVLTGLTPCAVYFFQVASTDPSGNGPTESGISSFELPCESNEEPPSFLRGPIIASITNVSASVEWETDAPADSAVFYGKTPALGSLIENNVFVVNHRIDLTGLTPDTEYFVQVESMGLNGFGPALSNVLSFFTLAQPDTSPPVITNGPLAIDITDIGATIIWETDESATTGVSYNDGTIFGLILDNALTTSHSVRLTGLTPSTLYHCTVSTRDGLNNGPTLSGPFDFTTSATPDTTPPVITEGPEVVNTTVRSAMIRWVTDESANSTVEYGLTQALGSVTSQSDPKQEHEITLTGLRINTDYFYRAISTDDAGNTVTSSIESFRTAVLPDIRPAIPVRRPIVLGAAGSKATVYFQTDEPSDTEIDFVDEANRHFRRADSRRTTEHWMTLTNLISGHTYGLAVRTTDLAGNVYSSLDDKNGSKALISFTVGEADVTAPLIVEGPTAVSVNNTSALIRWVTNELADTRVTYGVEGGGLNQVAGDIAYSLEHLVVLTNLTPSTAYSVKAASQDVDGNGPTVSGIVGFATNAAADTVGPAFTAAPTAIEITDSGAVVEWQTDELATSQVRFGVVSDAQNSIATVIGLTADHRVALTNLTPDTTYFCTAISRDSSGNASASTTTEFTTAEGASSPTADIDSSGTIDAVDVQLVINAALGLSIGSLDADVDASGTIDAVDVQLVINAALGIGL